MPSQFFLLKLSHWRPCHQRVMPFPSISCIHIIKPPCGIKLMYNILCCPHKKPWDGQSTTGCLCMFRHQCQTPAYSSGISAVTTQQDIEWAIVHARSKSYLAARVMLFTEILVHGWTEASACFSVVIFQSFMFINWWKILGGQGISRKKCWRIAQYLVKDECMCGTIIITLIDLLKFGISKVTTCSWNMFR